MEKEKGREKWMKSGKERGAKMGRKGRRKEEGGGKGGGGSCLSLLLWIDSIMCRCDGWSCCSLLVALRGRSRESKRPQARLLELT